MGFLSALGDFVTAVSDAVGDYDDYTLLALAMSKIGTKKSYSKADIEKMENSKGRISFTIRKNIRDDDLDLSDLPGEAQAMVVAILTNVEKQGEKLVTVDYTVAEWSKKASTCGRYDVLKRDKIIRYSKDW